MSVPLAFAQRSAAVVSCLRSGKHALRRARAWLRTMAAPGQQRTVATRPRMAPSGSTPYTSTRCGRDRLHLECNSKKTPRPDGRGVKARNN